MRNIVFTGIGGTGVTTTASVLAMAAHIDGLSASVVDMTGLAQKGGAVFSHVRIGETEDTPVGGRVPAASAHVLIACDLLVAAGPEALALFAKDRTVALGNADLLPTADFVVNRDARFDAPAMARRLASACKSYDGCPAAEMAEQRFGDSLYANMIDLRKHLRNINLLHTGDALTGRQGAPKSRPGAAPKTPVKRLGNSPKIPEGSILSRLSCARALKKASRVSVIEVTPSIAF